MPRDQRKLTRADPASSKSGNLMGLGAGFTVCEQTYSIIYIVEYIVEGNKESHQERHFIKKRALIRKGDVSS